MTPSLSNETVIAADDFVRNGLPPLDAWPQLWNVTDATSPLDGNFTIALLDRQVAQGHGDALALMGFDGGDIGTLSYRELSTHVAQLARVLVDDAGLRPGQRVLLRGPNSLMMAACWLAVLRVGGVAVTTMPLLRAKELQQVVEKARIDLALCDARFADEIQTCRSQHRSGLPSRVLFFNGDAPDGLERRMRTKPGHLEAHPCTHDTPALIAFTSGTTGVPKGTVHFHRDLFAICETFSRHILQLRHGDRCCGTPPLGFTYGLGVLLCFPLYGGATSVLSDKPGAASLVDVIERCAATVVFTAPTMYRQMVALASPARLGSLRMSVSAGEALSQATRDAWRDATGLEMVDGLGSTEMLHVFISSTPDQHRQGAIGRAVPGYEIAVLDQALRPLPAGEQGLLAVRGVTGCRYLSDERQHTYVRQGWNLPGDVGHLDADGYFHYAGRCDDLIVSAGYNISNLEVEEALLSHPDIADCAVIGVPDELRGQVVQAHVVLRTGLVGGDALGRGIQEHVKALLAPFKYPRSILFCEQLPRTESNKLQRFRLRSQAAQ